MSLHCFFGLELSEVGLQYIPPIPKHSNLVITHAAVTAVVPPPNEAEHHHKNKNNNHSKKENVYSPIALCVQGDNITDRITVGTLDPQNGITYLPLQLIFSSAVTFTLETRNNNNNNQNKSVFYPTVHLTGYYETEEEENEDEMDEEMFENFQNNKNKNNDDDEDLDEDEPMIMSRGKNVGYSENKKRPRK
ncbi:Nucleoplasmin-like domain containing protein, putative [Angomonas deanei]|uniref:Nucleoplasmin-like domain containing protein, putative n=1 Tax=Angomonas deanei TaxID=59799 RepID=A0A7G2CRH1_9TRYP|nr:Nucleoplasmin-like domain containing protein, putative [Angomonas deanei]